MDPERLEQLTQQVGGRFRLTSLLQKRMAELVRGSPSMLDVPPDVADDLFEVALREIEAGRIELIRPWTAEDALPAGAADELGDGEEETAEEKSEDEEGKE